VTVTANPPQAGPAQKPPHRRHLAAIVAAVAVLAAGAGIGIGLAVSGGTPSSGPAGPAAAAPYSYYQSMMGRYSGGAGSMMGGGSGWSSMMGRSGYAWMMGGAAAPGWMTGGTLPAWMMGGNTDMGQVMGALLADAPGPRVSAAEAATLGDQVPGGATIDRTANRITFTVGTVNLAVVASPAGGPDETFRIAGLVNPTIIVPPGARMTVQLVNADPDTATGWSSPAPTGRRRGCP
jgi:hypothetical protein